MGGKIRSNFRYNIGINNPKASKKELQILILKKLNAGRLKVLSPNNNKNSSTEKQKEHWRKKLKENQKHMPENYKVIKIKVVKTVEGDKMEKKYIFF